MLGPMTPKQVRLARFAANHVKNNTTWGQVVTVFLKPHKGGVRFGVIHVDCSQTFIVRIMLEPSMSPIELWLVCQRMMATLSSSYADYQRMMAAKADRGNGAPQDDDCCGQ